MANNLLTMCSRCEKIQVDGKWVGRDSYSTYDEMVRIHNISHDYCPECVELYKKEYKELKKMYQL